MDSREGFTKGDKVTQAGEGPFPLPRDGVVQGWLTAELDPTKWYCCVTFGGRYIVQAQARDLEHVQPE
ncbi:hypothetical protein ACFWGE_32830 [Streptomyces bacillaris]|uniref:hypothetical protein n=1 Tax=Streptomyces griseus group TaxID=629295 RepID=UPI00345FF69F